MIRSLSCDIVDAPRMATSRCDLSGGVGTDPSGVGGDNDWNQKMD